MSTDYLDDCTESLDDEGVKRVLGEMVEDQKNEEESDRWHEEQEELEKFEEEWGDDE